MRPLLIVLLVLAAVASSAPLLVAQPQMPGDSPRLVASDGVSQAPSMGGPFDSTGVLSTQGGADLNLSLDYLSEGLINEDVAWGLLLSSQLTPFPLTQLPPPLYVLPPFRLIIPAGGMLDVQGQGGLNIPLPAGLVSGTAYLQAIVQDPGGLGGTVLKLSNGVRVDIGPPDYNAAFSFVLSIPEIEPMTLTETSEALEGVAQRDFGPNDLKSLPPFGFGVAPGPDTDDVFDPGFRFLPIVPTGIDGPVRPLDSRPVTFVTADISGTDDTELLVEDTAGFPRSGKLFINIDGSNLTANKASGANQLTPDVEVVHYTGKTPTSFTGLSRKQLGSEGESVYPHETGDVVLGDYTMVTTAGILSRDRVGLDARNADIPKVTLPAFTFTPATGGDGGPPEPQTREIDILRYEVLDTGVQGYATLDHQTHAIERIPGTEFDPADGFHWDPIITVTPDHRSFFATLRVDTGIDEGFFSDPDRLFAIRLDGEEWPASSAEVWEITYELEDEPVAEDNQIRSRFIYPESMVILNQDPEDFVAYVGLGYKFRQSDEGTVRAQIGGDIVGAEAFWIREEALVRDMIEIAIVQPGSGKSAPSMPRPYLSDDFPELGNGSFISRFDPVPVVSPSRDMLAISAGRSTNEEDIYVIRNVSVNGDGSVSRFIFNITGFGLLTGSGEGNGSANALSILRGAGVGRRLAFSPDSEWLAWSSRQNNTKDFLNVARTNGVDYGDVVDQYKVTIVEDGTTTIEFLEGGPFNDSSAVMNLHWADDTNVLFFMGEYDISEGLYLSDPAALPRLDLFSFSVDTEIMQNVSRTHSALGDFDSFGTFRPLTSWESRDGRYIFYLRDGPISAGNTVLPPGSPVTNLVAYDREAKELIDVSGDEFGDTASIPNLRIRQPDFRTMVEAPTEYDFTFGSGVQDEVVWFDSSTALDDDLVEQLFSFRETAPTLAFQASFSTIPGSAVTNLTPSPYSGKIAFARTNTSNANGNTQHPYIIDVDSFLYERDLAPSVVSAGEPFGRVMDGSLHFIQPTVESSEGFVFSFGLATLEPAIVAAQTGVFYLSMDNVSDPVLEPEPRVISMVNTLPLGVGAFPQVYVLSAGPSSLATPIDP